MVFIDADKDNYINYYNFILDNNLLRMRGVICVDNTLFKSKVYLNDVTDANGLALRRFNQFVSADPRVEQVAFFFRPLTDSTTASTAALLLFIHQCLFLGIGQVILPLRDGLSIIRRVPATSEGFKAQVTVGEKKKKKEQQNFLVNASDSVCFFLN